MNAAIPMPTSYEQPDFITPGRQMLIGGRWVDASSGRTIDAQNPSTGAVIGTVPEGDEVDVDRAVAAARAAFEGPWSKFTPRDRQRCLLALADLAEDAFVELKLIESYDIGRPIGAPFGPALITEVLRYYAGAATRIQGATVPNSAPVPMFSYTLKEPVGVVGAIVPWNGPVTLAVWKLAPALAAGCTVVVKAPEDASLSLLRFAELVAEAGIPNGVVNVITGYGPVVGAAMAAHPGIDKIAFTGSPETGQAIMRAAAGSLKALTLELGGKSPDIVMADADLEAAAPVVAMAVFASSGQVCIAGSRLFVHRSVQEELVERVVAFAEGLRLGPGTDPETTLGPLVSRRQLDRVRSYLDSADEEGATARTGGRVATGPGLEGGHFVEPTVYDGLRDDMRVVREEVFGPVISVLPFDDEDEVVRRANDTPYGLAGGLWTRDLGVAHRMSARLRVGAVYVNTYGAGDPAVPFGGVKLSGQGRELGAEGLDGYLTTKSVWMSTT